MNNKPTAIVFGCGNTYLRHYHYIHNYFDVVAIVDNYKQGEEVKGKKVMPSDILLTTQFEYILIAAEYGDFALKIKEQLLKMGIPLSKIRLTGAEGISPYKIDPLFFATNLSINDKKKLFSENMERIILELNSKCNRKCWFCTNSLFHGNEENADMPEEVFQKIIDELADIQYSQEICLSLFNEPLISSKLEGRIQIIKKRLPNCFIYAFSNGDYLTKDRIASLEASGLDLLITDIYMDKLSYDLHEAYERASKLCKKLELPVCFENHEERIYGHCMFKNLMLEFISQDFSTSACNRAESLPDSLPIPKITSHPLPCVKNFMSFHIDFRGDTWPCPNFHHEFEAHKQYCLGNVMDESIFDIYIGKKLTDYRERNFFHRDTLPCRSCINNFQIFVTNRFVRPFRDRPGVLL